MYPNKLAFIKLERKIRIRGGIKLQSRDSNIS